MRMYMCVRASVRASVCVRVHSWTVPSRKAAEIKIVTFLVLDSAKKTFNTEIIMIRFGGKMVVRIRRLKSFIY